MSPSPRLQTFTHQSPIGHWSVRVWQPDARLAEIVASMWFGCGKTAYQRDRILPSGQSQLLINLGPPQYRIEPGPPEKRVPFVDIWYSALHQGPIDTEAPHGNALLGVAFTARGTFPWLGERMDGWMDGFTQHCAPLGSGAEEKWCRERNSGRRRTFLSFGGVGCGVRWAFARDCV